VPKALTAPHPAIARLIAQDDTRIYLEVSSMLYRPILFSLDTADYKAFA
jgi:hypothetical protein